MATKGLASFNLKQRRPHQQGNPQKAGMVQKGASAGAVPLVFGGEGHQLILHIDKGNATCYLKGFNNGQHCFYIN
eukprot:8541008-Ditylum_brightwellii.AAC.1